MAAPILRAQDCDEVMAKYGPEALPWFKWLVTQPGTPARTPRHKLAAQQQPPPALPLTPPLLYELYICTREEDALCHPKLELLAACGLGCVHYLTEGMESEVGGRQGSSGVSVTCSVCPELLFEKFRFPGSLFQMFPV